MQHGQPGEQKISFPSSLMPTAGISSSQCSPVWVQGGRTLNGVQLCGFLWTLISQFPIASPLGLQCEFRSFLLGFLAILWDYNVSSEVFCLDFCSPDGKPFGQGMTHQPTVRQHRGMDAGSALPSFPVRVPRGFVPVLTPPELWAGAQQAAGSTGAVLCPVPSSMPIPRAQEPPCRAGSVPAWQSEQLLITAK